jgi:hypothetical protein
MQPPARQSPVSPAAANTGKGIGSRRWASVAGFGIGLLLLGACIYALARDPESLRCAAASLTRAPAWAYVLLLVLPALNWLLTSELSYTLMLPREGETYVAPTRPEMIELIGAAWLANYIPVRPGLFGRIAYHRAVNKIPLARTVHALILTIACGLMAVVTLLITARLIPAGTPDGVTAVAVVMPGALLAVLARLAAKVRVSWSHILDACGLRYADMLVWTGRYALVFYLVGQPLDLRSAVALAAVSQAAMLVPFVGNGLGVREAAIAVLGAALPAWYSSGEPLDRSLAIAAEVVNRAGEVLAACIIGSSCGVRLARRLRGISGNLSGNPSHEVSSNAGDRT